MKKISRFLAFHWPLLLAAAVFLFVNTPLWRMSGIAAGGDGLLLFYPAMHAVKQSLANGRLPFWTTNLQAGFPLLADGQPSALYPANLLLLALLSVPAAYNLAILLHGLLALIFTYAWMRLLKISRPASALTALLFVLLTPLTGSNLPMLEALTWTPALFFLAEKSLQSGKPSSLWVISLVAGLQWLTGFPQMALYSLIAASVYFAARLLWQPFSWKQRVRWLAGWTAAVALGLLLAAPLLWPTWELTRFSIRANGISGSMAGEKSLFPLVLSVFLLPTTRTFWGQAGLGGGAYITVIPFLIALGSFFRKPKPNWFYPVATMSIITVILAFGRFSPLFPLVRQIPGLSSFRVPARFLVLVQFGLLTLFGWHWDRLFAEATAGKRQTQIFQYAAILFVLFSLAGYVSLSWLKPALTNLARQITFTYIVNDTYHLQSETYYLQKIDTLYQNARNAMWAGLGTIAPLSSLVFAWLIMRWQKKGVLSPKWAYAGLLVLIGFDLFVFTGGFRQTAPLELVTTPPLAAQLAQENKPDQLCRIYSLTDEKAILFQEGNLNLLPANYNMVWNLPGTGLYSPLGFFDYYRLMEGLGGVNLAFGSRPVPAANIEENRALLDYLNVCLILSRVELDGFDLVGEADGVFVYRNDSFLPRAYAVDELVILPEGADATTAVLRQMGHLAEKAILSKSIKTELTPGAAQKAQITRQTYKDTAVTLEIDTPGVILLQLSDTNYPGWRATIDGQPAELLTVNGLFRGVVVPRGRHEITFTYAPITFYRGVGLAATALAFSIIWAGTWIKSNRK